MPVADTTTEADREVKIPLCAKSGILEVWLIDLNEPVVEVYQSPLSNGYQTVKTLQLGKCLFVSAFSEVELKVNDLIG